MKVRIISVKHGNCWYKNKIGIKFDVKHWSINRYRLNGRAAYIYKSDCEIVEDEMIDKLVGVLDTQVGGNHYKDMPIQFIDFVTQNDIPFREASIIKYVCRHKTKDGLKDLKKAEHYLQMLIKSYE